MTTSHDAVQALLDAARAVLDSDTDPEGGLHSVHWRRAGALRKAVAAVEAAQYLYRCRHPGCTRTWRWVPGILSPPVPVPPPEYCDEHRTVEVLP